MTIIKTAFRAPSPTAPTDSAPSFNQVLILNLVGWVILLGAITLAGIVWQHIANTEKITRQQMHETQGRVHERLKILVRAMEMTSESAERVGREQPLTAATLQPTLERALSAFEQRPELSYISVSLPEKGEYGALQRTTEGKIILWLFPGTRSENAYRQKLVLTDKGFVLEKQLPANGYDPRTRPFYQAALSAPASGGWIPSYEWIVHEGEPPTWGFSHGKALYDNNGRMIGVLDIAMELRALNHFLRGLDAEYHTQSQVVELGAQPLLIGAPHIDGTPLPLATELTPLLSFNGDDFLDRMEVAGEQRWVAASRLALKDGKSWLVITSREATLFGESFLHQLYQMAAIALALIIGLILISVRMSRRFGSPLIALEQRVNNIGWQELDAPAETQKLINKEFRETQILREALDRMALGVAQILEAKEQQAASLALKSAIFDSTHTAIFSLDHQQSLLEWNAAAEQLFGWQQQPHGLTITEAISLPTKFADWATIVGTQGTGTYQLTGARGLFDAEVRVATFKRNGQDVCTLFIDDISERKHAENALRESLARFHAASLATGDALWDWDLTTDTIWRSENFQKLFGYSKDDTDNTLAFWSQRIHPDDQKRVVDDLNHCVNSNQEIWAYEYRFRCKDGHYADIIDRGYVLRDDQGRGIRMVGAIQDVTEHKMAQQRIIHLATHDSLTGLPNRHLIQERIEQAIAHAQRSNTYLALLYLDLDRFKIINDNYGHPFGDMVLKVVAKQLVSLVRSGDTISRQGGDEFLILLTDLHQATDAYLVAQKFIKHLNGTVVINERKVHLSCSIGVSVFPQDGDSTEVLIDNADLAMYRAKNQGRNAYQFFSREMSEETSQRAHLEAQLREALSCNQLHLAYQPKIDLSTGCIIGCEALLRWHHPQLGHISPANFIPIAEDSGLIVPIGDWVLRQACAQAKAWADAGLPPIVVAVNISVRQFMQQDVVSWVMGVLAETNLPAAQLELELTESLIAQDVEKVIATFDQLRAAGVKLSIDDFGTGYSNLNYLKRFPVDTLKIDQSFVRDMLTNSEDITIVLAIISLAHNLKFKVIAEGVETKAQCDFLREHQCDEIQGYYFSRPLPAAEFEIMLNNDKRLF